MLENTLTINQTPAARRTRSAATRVNAPIARATGDRSEPQAAGPVGAGDAPATSGLARPLRRWSVADLIARSRFANER
jgi:hypothetical protein